MRVADFHCDLLSYLSNDPKRGVRDAESQASVEALTQGCVAIQTFPIYTETAPSSVESGTRQFEIFGNLSVLDPDFFGPRLRYKLAIENGSGFCSEQESIEEGLHRLESWWKKTPIQYISLTWNEENRFGGGADTKIGLKEDGKRLLKWMSGKKIAVDLSHASDLLAEEILKETQMLDVLPIASHSNFREVCNHRRNLPDHLAKEIAHRKGLIGLNMVRHFLGKEGPHVLLAHIHHAHKLGVENSLCLGADFFGEIDTSKEKSHLRPFFFEGFSSSACYPKIRNLLLAAFSEEFIDNFMYYRLNHFLET